jgi:hypothetical protein
MVDVHRAAWRRVHQEDQPRRRRRQT